MEQPNDLKQSDYQRILLEMSALRDKHVRAIKKLLDCPHHVAIQVEAQMRHLLPPLYS